MVQIARSRMREIKSDRLLERSVRHIAHVGLGSNVDDPVSRVSRAFVQLARIPTSNLTARSSLYRSAPVGKLDQPPFVNAVAVLSTALTPDELLLALLDIEALHGRVREERNGPRTLDLDLLLYDRQTVRLPGLDIPHPRMHERAFVLVPLSEVSPDTIIPGRGAVSALLASVMNQSVSRV